MLIRPRNCPLATAGVYFVLAVVIGSTLPVWPMWHRVQPPEVGAAGRPEYGPLWDMLGDLARAAEAARRHNTGWPTLRSYASHLLPGSVFLILAFVGGGVVYAANLPRGWTNRSDGFP